VTLSLEVILGDGITIYDRSGTYDAGDRVGITEQWLVSEI
jgi:hypothetical protein